MNKLASLIIKSCITIGIASLLAFAIAWSRGVFGATDTKVVMHVLSDSAFIVGVLFCGMGVLMLIASDGTYDALNYSIKAAFMALTFRRSKRQSFAEYKASKDRVEKVRVMHILIAGAIHILLAVVFLIAYRA